MRKIMEVYEAENGIVIEKDKTVYHLFGTDREKSTESVKIADAKEAFYFLANFFFDKLELEKREVQKFDTGEHIVHLHFTIKEGK